MTNDQTATRDSADVRDDDRPKPYPHEGDSRPETDKAESDGEDGDFTYGEDESQQFVDRDAVDFDPADGLYTGSAIDGGSNIPGPSEADIRKAQEELGDDQDGDAGAKAAAEKYIDENDVDLEEAQKGEAIAGSAQSSGDKGDDS